MINDAHEVDWRPAKTRASVASIQEHIAANPSDRFNLYYFITPEYIFEHFDEVASLFEEHQLCKPARPSDVSHEVAKLFVAAKYDIEPSACMDIEVGRSASAFGWGIAVSEEVLKDKGVELVDWDYDTYVSKEAIRRMHMARARDARQ